MRQSFKRITGTPPDKLIPFSLSKGIFYRIHDMPRTKVFFVILALFVIAIVLWFRLGNGFPEWLSGVVTVWIWLIGPVALIMTGLSAREEVQFENPRGLTGAVMRFLVCTPLGCFGIICVGAGLGVFTLAVWSAWEKDDYSLIRNVPGLLVFVGIMGFGWCVVRYAMRGEGPTRKEIEEAERARLEALRNPDWDFYSRHLGRSIPNELRSLYGDPRLNSALPTLPDLQAEEDSIEFWPLHEDYLVSAEESGLPFDIVPLAMACDQNWIFLKPGERESNQVWMIDPEEPGDLIVVSDSFESFFSALTWEEVPSSGN